MCALTHTAVHKGGAVQGRVAALTGGGGGGAMLGSVLVSVSEVTGAAGLHNGLEVSSARRWDEWLW